MNDPKWDEIWDELEEFAMGYNTAVIPFSAEGYLEEFYDTYRIRNRNPVLVPAEEGFAETLKVVCGPYRYLPVAEKIKSLFGIPSKIFVFDDDSELREKLGGRRGLSPFFFVFDIMFCEYDDFTICFMSGSND